MLQRDYWAVFAGCAVKPSDLMAFVKAHFCALPPASLVEFAVEDGLDVDDELDINIVPAQHCRVRVIHTDACSLTLATLQGHPEAGRITFGAYRNPEGDVIFHIRSRARAASTTALLGFFALGEAMQTNTWTDFVNNTAAAVGARVLDAIHVETVEAGERPDDGEPLNAPTFVAKGD